MQRQKEQLDQNAPNDERDPQRHECSAQQAPECRGGEAFGFGRMVGFCHISRPAVNARTRTASQPI